MSEDMRVICETLDIVRGFPLVYQVKFLVIAYQMDEDLRRIFVTFLVGLATLILLLVLMIGDLPRDLAILNGIVIGVLLIVLIILVSFLPHNKR